MQSSSLILTLVCQDKIGIVAAVAGFLAQQCCNIEESAQFYDSDSGRFFLRTQFSDTIGYGAENLRSAFLNIAQSFNMDWQLNEPGQPTKVLILVSKFGHCLQELLYQHHSGSLPMHITTVVSNHPDLENMASFYRVPFLYLPVSSLKTHALEAIITEKQPDLVILARYMQILPAHLADKLSGRCINIHHSFLPSFKGARPYHQAHQRGVKIIGATAHYVTPDLDEGPIIDQETDRVSHAHTPQQLVDMGRHLESLVLSRAVKAHLERRVLLNGNRTVVFS
jgi:formyltetrahydrofolate deformylase